MDIDKYNKQAFEKPTLESTAWESNGIRLSHSISTFNTLGTFHAHNSKDVVRLHFGLSGDYRFAYKQLNQSFDLAGGHHNIMYSQGLDLEISNKTLLIETFGIDFPKSIFCDYMQDEDDLLKSFTDHISSGRSSLLCPRWGAITIPIQRAIDEVILSPYTGSLQNIFLLSKSLELLVLCVDQYKQFSNQRISYIKSKEDKERIIAARDFINHRISSPPSLSEIARQVGLNEFKLKNGFKEVFQSTVFNYLTERRMNLAKQYLLDTQRPIAAIAIDLGYSSPQHFSVAFKKSYGLPPTEFRQKN